MVRYLVDSFLTMLRKDKMTPYTSFASSSNVRAFDFWASGCGWAGVGSWPMATTKPVEEERVLRGLVNVEFVDAAVSTACGATARDTAVGMPPPSTAGLSGRVRCQSW